MCMIAVKNHGESVAFTPEKFKTAELCYEAVKRRKTAFAFIPEKYRTHEMLMDLMEEWSYDTSRFTIKDKLIALKYMNINYPSTTIVQK
jgi:bifunctional DNase/RNase